MNPREWLAAAVIGVLAVAAAFYLLRDDSDPPASGSEPDPPSARVMSPAAAVELLDELSGQGWGCYDSLARPIVKRCFLDEVVDAGGTVGAEVALTFADSFVARVNVYAAGERDQGRHVEVAEQTAMLVGDLLLDGAGADLASRVGDRQETELAGRQVVGNRASGSSTQVVVESAAYDDQGLPLPDFPAEEVLVRRAEEAGLTCAEDGESTTCNSTAGSTSMTITMSEASGGVRSMSISASNYAVPDDPAVINMVSGYLFEAELGGTQSSVWVRDHVGSPVPARADFGGLHFRLSGGQGRAIYLSVGQITN